MKRWLNTLALLTTLVGCIVLTGCSTFIPKRVELGQDKVQRFPTPKPSERETQRQAAQRSADVSRLVLENAILAGAGETVVEPAKDSVALTRAISDSLGPPLKPAGPAVTAAELAQALDRAMAKLNQRIDEFRADNDKNVGHKIEGTGWLSVPYFMWLGGALFIGFILFTVAKVLLGLAGAANPAVGVGLSAVRLGGRGAAALASQVVKGGKLFREKLAEEEPAVRERIEKLFVSSQKEAQSPETQDAVRKLLS